MGILDKFFGEGYRRGRVGNITGRVEHDGDGHNADIYNNKGEYEGHIETYGDSVTRYDKYGRIVSDGYYDEKENSINMINNDGRLEEINTYEDRSYVSNSSGLFAQESYSVSDCCGYDGMGSDYGSSFDSSPDYSTVDSIWDDLDDYMDMDF